MSTGLFCFWEASTYGVEPWGFVLSKPQRSHTLQGLWFGDCWGEGHQSLLSLASRCLRSSVFDLVFQIWIQHFSGKRLVQKYSWLSVHSWHPSIILIKLTHAHWHFQVPKRAVMFWEENAGSTKLDLFVSWQPWLLYCQSRFIWNPKE